MTREALLKYLLNEAIDGLEVIARLDNPHAVSAESFLKANPESLRGALASDVKIARDRLVKIQATLERTLDDEHAKEKELVQSVSH